MALVREWRRRPADANALADGAAGAPPPATAGTVALGHTECDVVRGIGAPDNVNLSNNARGDRVAVVTYSRGQRAGIYTFTAGRLTSIERGPEPVAQPKAAKPKQEEAGGDVKHRRAFAISVSARRFVILRTCLQPFFLGALQRALPRRRAPC